MGNQINKTRLGRSSFLWLLGLSLFGISSVGHALAIGGSSSSYGESVNLTLTVPALGSNMVANSNPQPVSSGTSPGPYNDSDSAASSSAVGTFSVFGEVSLTTGLLITNAASDISGATGAKTSSADSTVANSVLNILLGTHLIGFDLLKLTASEIQSSSVITGDFNALTAVGSTSLANAFLNNSLLLSANPAPNTHVDVLGLLGLAGVNLILNEQILTGDGLTNRGLEVNAIHIGFTDFALGLNVLNGDIIIAHSEAQFLAQADPAQVPEPGTLALAMMALAALVWFRRLAPPDPIANEGVLSP